VSHKESHKVHRKAPHRTKPVAKPRRTHAVHKRSHKTKKETKREKTVLEMLKVARQEIKDGQARVDRDGQVVFKRVKAPVLSHLIGEDKHLHAARLIQAKHPMPANAFKAKKPVHKKQARKGSFAKSRLGKLLKDPSQVTKMKIAALKFGHQGGSIKNFLKREGKALKSEHAEDVPSTRRVMRRLSHVKRKATGHVMKGLPLVGSEAVETSHDMSRHVSRKAQRKAKTAKKTADMVKNVMANMPGYKQQLYVPGGAPPTPQLSVAELVEMENGHFVDDEEEEVEDPTKTWKAFKAKWDANDGEWNDKEPEHRPGQVPSWEEHYEAVHDTHASSANFKKPGAHSDHRPIVRGNSISGVHAKHMHPNTGENSLKAHDSDQEVGVDHDASGEVGGGGE